VGSDLDGLWPAKAASGDGFLDLLPTRTGRVKVLPRIAFDLGCAALPGLDLIAQISKLRHGNARKRKQPGSTQVSITVTSESRSSALDLKEQ
jgi:hypothetical protein